MKARTVHGVFVFAATFLLLLGVACDPSRFDGYVIDGYLLDVDAAVASPPRGDASSPSPAPGDASGPRPAPGDAASPNPADGGTAWPLAVAVCGGACPKGYRSTAVIGFNYACGGTDDCTSQAELICGLADAYAELIGVYDEPCKSGTHDVVRVSNDCPPYGHDGGTGAVCAPN